MTWTPQRGVPTKNEFCNCPDSSQREENPGQGKSVVAAGAEDRHRDGGHNDECKRSSSCGSWLRIHSQRICGTNCKHEMEKGQPTKAPPKQSGRRKQSNQHHNKKQSATPKSIGKIEKTFRVSTKDLADNHAVRSSNIKTVYGKPPVTRRYTNGAGQRNLHFVLC